MASLPPVPYLPPGGPAVPPPPCPLGGEYYYPREKWWMPHPQQSFALISPWPRMPVESQGPQGYSITPVAETAKHVPRSQIGIGGITAYALGSQGCPTPWSERTLYSRPKAADAEQDIKEQATKDEEQANTPRFTAPRWWPFG